MDLSEAMVSSDSKSSSNSMSLKKTKSSQRVPMCTRCQNHGIKVAVKFHKRECKHRFCMCDKCIFTSQRQHFMKVATAERRARQQYEEKMQMQKAQKKKAMSESSVSNSNDSNSRDTPPTLNNHSNHSSTSDLCKAVNEPIVKPPPVPNLPPLLPQSGPLSTVLFQTESNIEQVEVLLGYSAKLLQRFGYPWEALALMYVILKDARADVETAMRRITIDLADRSFIMNLLLPMKSFLKIKTFY